MPGRADDNDTDQTSSLGCHAPAIDLTSVKVIHLIIRGYLGEDEMVKGRLAMRDIGSGASSHKLGRTRKKVLGEDSQVRRMKTTAYRAQFRLATQRSSASRLSRS
jgi:hypothetical protein